MPVNPELYQSVAWAFPGPVEIVNAGEPIRGKVERDARTGRNGFVIYDRGETYAVPCPFCRDTYRRLYINAAYGTQIPDCNTFTFAKCFRRDCLADPAHRELLRMLLCGAVAPDHSTRTGRPGMLPSGGVPAAAAAIVAPPEPWQADPQTHVPLPGSVVSLADLPANHAARQYLSGRGFDPDRLAREYDICYVDRADEKHATAQGRILIPIFAGGYLRSWQARYVGTPANRATAKYYTAAGSPVGRLLYGLDAARRYPWAVVVEGATSVWALGAPAVATFGSTIGGAKQELLREAFPGGVVFMHDVDVRPDDDVYNRNAATKRRETFAALQRLLPGSIDFPLPANTDPADYDPAELWPCILDAAVKAGLPAIDPPLLRPAAAV